MHIRDLIESPLTEMPIRSTTLVGDFSKASSFKKADDRAIVSSPKGQSKLVRMFEKTPHVFHMIFVNLPEGTRSRENGRMIPETGEVTPDWVQTHMPDTYLSMTQQGLPIPDGITMIFTNNRGDARYPMTPWIVAHRIGHAMQAGINTEIGERFQRVANWFFNEIGHLINYAYGDRFSHMTQKKWINYRFDQKNRSMDKIIKSFFTQIGKMKSARDNNLRNEFEFFYDLIAQYLITGRIAFNPLPSSIKYYSGADRERGFSVFHELNDHDIDYYNGVLESLAEGLENDLDGLFSRMHGRIFVM